MPVTTTGTAIYSLVRQIAPQVQVLTLNSLPVRETLETVYLHNECEIVEKHRAPGGAGRVASPPQPPAPTSPPQPVGFVHGDFLAESPRSQGGSQRFQDIRLQHPSASPPGYPSVATLHPPGLPRPPVPPPNNAPPRRVAKETASRDGGNCCVCLEPLENGRNTCTTRCGHVFHEPCFSGWTARSLRSATCPACRELIDPDELVLDFRTEHQGSQFSISSDPENEGAASKWETEDEAEREHSCPWLLPLPQVHIPIRPSPDIGHPLPLSQDYFTT